MDTSGTDLTGRAASVPHMGLPTIGDWAGIAEDRRLGANRASSQRTNSVQAAKPHAFEAMQNLGEGPEAGFWERYTNPVHPQAPEQPQTQRLHLLQQPQQQQRPPSQQRRGSCAGDGIFDYSSARSSLDHIYCAPSPLRLRCAV